MKKLSEITESIWSDLQDRSSGEITRKEDNVNNLDFDGLYAYVNKKYKDVVHKIDSGELLGNDGKYCEIFPLDDNIWLSIFYKRSGEIRNIFIHGVVNESLIDKLEERFKILDYSRISEYMNIAEKDGTLCNQTYIDLIDFFLNCTVRDVNESIWSDLQDRCSGEVKRKEDDIDHYTRDQLVEYLNNRYEPIPPHPKNYHFVVDFRKSHLNCIAFHYMEVEGGKTINGRYNTYPVLLFGIDDDNLSVAVGPQFRIDVPDVYNELLENYILEIRKEDSGNNIKPKNGKAVTFSFYIEIIDFLLNRVKSPFTKIIDIVK